MNTLFTNFLHVLKRFTTSSIINILGLSAALMVFFVVLIQVYYDFTFDRGYKNADRIALLNIYDFNNGITGGNVNLQIPAQISSRFPEVEAYCMINRVRGKFDIDKGTGTPETHEVPFMLTTQGFFKVFTPEIIMGDTNNIFSLPGKIMLSEKTAQRLFGNENPIGKALINYYENNQQGIIQAVYRDFPDNASLENGLFSYMPEYNAGEWSFSAYFLIHQGRLKDANQKMNTAEALGEEYIKFLEDNPEINIQFRLSSPNELYLYNNFGRGKRINTTLSLLAIGVVTLLIAFVNFVNLSLAMAPSRIRGINIRKILGINKITLRFIIAMESVLFTALALIIAFFGIYLLKGSVFAQELFPIVGISLKSYTGLLATASVIIMLFAFSIGLYTMRYSTSVNEAESLKGSFATGVKGVKLRNILIVIQFVTAIVLICVSIFIQKQNDFMQNYDWGIPKKNIIYLPLQGLGESAQFFGQEILRDPRIKDYCITRALPGQVGTNWRFDFEGKNVTMNIWSVDNRFFDFFDIPIIAGQKPEHMDSIVTQLVVNESFLKQYQFDESLVGKETNSFFGQGRIQAIAKNINYESLHDSIRPMAFGVLSQYNFFQYVLVKLNGTEIPNTIQSLEQTWNKFSKDPFETHFLDEDMDRLYQKETNMAKLIGLFGFIIVIIAVMGVYGLIAFNARYKAKEIAIRKVSGSTVQEIILMLNRNVLIQLGISFVIAVPVAWFIIKKWLENFAFKIPIYWWVFLLGGLIVLLITVFTVSAQSYGAAIKNPTKALNLE